MNHPTVRMALVVILITIIAAALYRCTSEPAPTPQPAPTFTDIQLPTLSE